jgi:hypothetical protein
MYYVPWNKQPLLCYSKHIQKYFGGLLTFSSLSPSLSLSLSLSLFLPLSFSLSLPLPPSHPFPFSFARSYAIYDLFSIVGIHIIIFALLSRIQSKKTGLFFLIVFLLPSHLPFPFINSIW